MADSNLDIAQSHSLDFNRILSVILTKLVFVVRTLNDTDSWRENKGIVGLQTKYRDKRQHKFSINDTPQLYRVVGIS